MKKKILIIVQHMPYPLNAGGKKAQFDFIESLRHVFDISFVFILQPSESGHFEELKRKWDNINFLPFVASHNIADTIQELPAKLKRGLARVLKERKLLGLAKTESDKLIIKNSTLFRSRISSLPRQFTSHVKEIVSGQKFDFIQVEFHQLIDLGAVLHSDAKKIFIHHELRYVREERETSLLSFKSDLIEQSLRDNKTHELNALRGYDLICTLSDHDRHELSSYLPEMPVYSSPIPLQASPEEVSFIFRNKLVFLGGEAHFPNKEGFDWFINKCWPMLKSTFPAIKLSVVGKWSELMINHYTSAFDDVEFQGFVDNLQTALSDSIVVVPIRIGSGIRIKIIDAVNVGAPFVSTSVGVEGLAFEHGRDCLIGNSAEEFCRQVQSIIENPELGGIIAKNAKNVLQNYYSYQLLIDTRKQMYDESNFRLNPKPANV
jgi:glycosyltransferase involved in cell wall biosynthesis